MFMKQQVMNANTHAYLSSYSEQLRAVHFLFEFNIILTEGRRSTGWRRKEHCNGSAVVNRTVDRYCKMLLTSCD